MKKAWLLVMPILLLMACGKHPVEVDREVLPKTEMAAGNLYGNGEEEIEPHYAAIYDADTWEALLTQMNSVNSVEDDFSETSIDFETEMIFAVFDDIQGNGGHLIWISEIVETEDEILVKVNKDDPTGEFLTTVMTQPYSIVKTTKSAKTIVFY